MKQCIESQSEGAFFYLTLEIIKMNATEIRTNMINRLVVMMSEEVSINCWWLPIKIRELYDKWHAHRKSDEARKYLIHACTRFSCGARVA
jgi:hypothetical protein